MPETEEEIDSWFEKEKERLAEMHYKALQNGKDIDKAKDDFDKKMKSVLKEYEERYDKMWAKKERHDKLHEPIDEFKEKFQEILKEYEDKYNELKESLINNYEDIMEQAEKEKFELELKWHRFLKDHKREKL